MEVLDKVSAGCGLSGLLDVYNCQRYSDYLIVVVVAVVVVIVVVVVHSSWKCWIKSVPAVVCLVYWMSTMIRDTPTTLLSTSGCISHLSATMI